MPFRHNQAAITILLNLKNKYPVIAMGKKKRKKKLIQNKYIRVIICVILTS